MRPLLLSIAIMLLTLSVSADYVITEPKMLADFANQDVEMNLFDGNQQKTLLENELLIEWTANDVRTWTGSYKDWQTSDIYLVPNEPRVRISTTVRRDPTRNTIHNLNLRVRDNEKQTHQFTEELTWAENETEKVVSWTLVPNMKTTTYWDGPKNGTLYFPVRLNGFTGSYGAGEGSVVLGSVTTVETSLLRDLVLPKLNGTGEFNIIEPGREVKAKLSLENQKDVNIRLRLESVKITDIDGKEILESPLEEARLVNLAPKQNLDLKLEITLPGTWKKGMYYVEYEFVHPDDPADRVTLRNQIAVMNPTNISENRSNGFLFGICSHPNTLDPQKVSNVIDIYNKEATLMGLVGAKVLRMDMGWWHIEPYEGSFDFNRFNAILDSFDKQNIEVAATLYQAPQWALQKGLLPKYDRWGIYLGKVFDQFGDRIRYWEIWNEPDLKPFADFSVCEYINLLEIARREARILPEGAQLLTGGFATMGHHASKKNGFQEGTLSMGRDYYDIHAYHEHSAFKDYVDAVDGHFLLMRERLAVTAPWWANETAISSAYISEQEQANTLIRKLIFAWSRGAIGYNWYNLVNKGNDPNGAEDNYGMVTHDYQPKAVFVAYNTLTSLLRDAEYVGETPINGGMLFEFEKNGSRILCGWMNEKSQTQVIVPANASDVIQYDIMSNETAVASLGSAAVLELNETPSFWKLVSRDPDGAIEQLVSFVEIPVLIPGNETEVSFSMELFAPSDTTYHLAFTAPTGVEITHATDWVTLEGVQRETYEGKIKVTSDFQSDEAQPYVSVAYTLEGYDEYYGVSETPLPIAKVITELVSEVDFWLNGKGNYWSLYNADPVNEHLLWTGQEDLSATVQMGLVSDALHLKIKVRDDIHHQPFSGSEVWQGDNIQLAFEFPGQSGVWLLGLTLPGKDGGEFGPPECTSWGEPAEEELSGEVCAGQMTLTVVREANKKDTTYNVSIPLPALGIDRDTLRQGFRFNLLINDNDGDGRKGGMRIAPGLGDQTDPSLYPILAIL